jgi:hypothetical protein
VGGDSYTLYFYNIIRFTLTGLQVKNTDGYGSAFRFSMNGTNSNATVYDCLFEYGSSTGGYYVFQGEVGPGTGTCHVYNCVMIYTGTGACSALMQLGRCNDVTVENCTTYALNNHTNNAGILCADGGDLSTYKLRNISTGCPSSTWTDYTTQFSHGSSTATLNNCSTTKTSGTTGFPSHTGRVVNVTPGNTYESVTSGSHNLALKSSDTTLKDAGSTGSYATSDVFGRTRTGTWDIGAFEVQGAVAALMRRRFNPLLRM